MKKKKYKSKNGMMKGFDKVWLYNTRDRPLRKDRGGFGERNRRKH